jgi:hypothetical protein
MIKSELPAGGRVASRWLNICQSAIGILLDAALWLPRFWIARSKLGNLAIMTERDCQDIGLTGCEIEGYLTHRNRLRRRGANGIWPQEPSGGE